MLQGYHTTGFVFCSLIFYFTRLGYCPKQGPEAAVKKNLFKQQLGEIVKVVSPYRPCVAARIFAVRILNAHLVKL